LARLGFAALAARMFYAWAAERDRFKAHARLSQMRALARQRQFEDALRLHDTHRGQGLGMEGVLLRAQILSIMGRATEALADHDRVLRYHDASHPAHQRASQMQKQLGAGR
jgi:hypothetical protein